MAPLRDLGALVELTRVFSRLRPDIVHTHNPKPGVYGRLAARVAGVPVVVNTVHGLYAQPGDPWARRAVVYGLERIAARCSHAELVQNVEDLPVLRRLGCPGREAPPARQRHRPRPLRPGTGRARRAARAAGDLESRRRRDRLRGRRPAGLGEGVPRGLRSRPAAARPRPRACTSSWSVRATTTRPRRSPRPTSNAPKRWATSISSVSAPTSRRATRPSTCTPSRRTAKASRGRRWKRPRWACPVVATDIRGCRQVVDDGRTGRLVPAATRGPRRRGRRARGRRSTAARDVRRRA